MTARRKIEEEMLTVQAGAIKVRMPLSMLAAESLSPTPWGRRSLREAYAAQARVRSDSGPLLALEIDGAPYFLRFQTGGSATAIAESVEIVDGRMNPLSQAARIAFGENDDLFRLVGLIGEAMSAIPDRQSVDRSQTWTIASAAVEGLGDRLTGGPAASTFFQGQAALDEILWHRTDVVSAYNREIETGYDASGAPATYSADRFFSILCERVASAASPADALSAAVGHIIRGAIDEGSVSSEVRLPKAGVNADHLDDLCSAIACRLRAAGLNEAAAPAAAAIGFLWQSPLTNIYDTVLVRDTLGLDMLSLSGRESVAALLKTDLMSGRGDTGVNRMAALSNVVTCLYSDIGMAVGNMIAEAPDEAKLLLASEAPNTGYLFGGMPNPHEPSSGTRAVVRGLLRAGGNTDPDHAAAMVLARAYGSAGDPLWEREGRVPALADLAPPLDRARPGSHPAL